MIIIPARSLDFGNGFYTTTNLEQAKKWAVIKQKRDNSEKAIISRYEFHDYLLLKSDLKFLDFDSPSEEWLEFILKNRLDKEFYHGYDLIKGPVANDRVYACLNAYENNFMDFAGVIRELKTYLLADQISFNSEKALGYLKYLSSERVDYTN